MNREQAVLKIEDTEIPVIALDAPLLWVVVLLGFVVIMFWLWRKG